MLVLSRKLNESILIGDHIEIKVLRVEGHYVKLGIAAPQDLRVDRKEVRELPNYRNPNDHLKTNP